MARDMYGVSEQPLDFDSSRINPSIRQALKDQAPGIATGVKAVADQPATPGRDDNRRDWRQPGSNRR
jgi:hypothetical protein